MNNETIKNFSKFSAGIALAWVFFYLVTFVVTPSIDRTVFLRDIFTNKPILSNDYVRFSIDHKLLGGKNSVVKIVGCTEGQFLERREDAFYCDDIKITPIRLYREKGDPLPQFHFAGKIPKNKLFVHGTDQYSFGSRHWGFLDTHDAQRMIPLI